MYSLRISSLSVYAQRREERESERERERERENVLLVRSTLPLRFLEKHVSSLAGYLPQPQKAGCRRACEVCKKTYVFILFSCKNYSLYLYL